MPENKPLTVATYNILHGYYEAMILANVKTLISRGVDVICLQEAEISFEKPLHELLNSPGFEEWRSCFVHEGLGGNLALLWNTSRISLQKTEMIRLPTTQLGLTQKIKGISVTIQRLALVGYFSTGGRTIRISNVHLAWEGGTGHRMAQLAYLKRRLDGDPMPADIIAGDFNTVNLSTFRKLQQGKILSVLKGYKDALPDISWTYDIAYTAPQDRFELVAKLCRRLRIKLRGCFDHIFIQGLSVDSAEMLDVPGSDHRPLIITISK